MTDNTQHLMRIYGITESQFTKEMESKPCACGDRQTSQPQKLLSCQATEADTGKAQEYELVVRGKFECGVCKQVHDGAIAIRLESFRKECRERMCQNELKIQESRENAQ